MPVWLEAVLVSLGSTLIAGLVAVAAKLPEKILDHSLAERMAAAKHDFDRQIEMLRDRLSHLADRGRRSNELEYDALMKAWERLVDAYIATMNVIISWTSVPSLNGLSDEKAREQLTRTDLNPDESDAVLAATDREAIYKKVFQSRRLNSAHAAIFDALQTIRKQGIFIPRDLEDHFKPVSPVPAYHGNADAGERRGHSLHSADAGSCPSPDHRDLHPRLHPQAPAGSRAHASGPATEGQSRRPAPSHIGPSERG